MESTDLNKLFYGTDAADKISKLKKGLLLIEKQYSEYFESRTSKLDGIDRLHNHYITVTDSHGMSFNFLEDSDLDRDIQLACHKLFNDIFNPQIVK